MAVEIKFLIDGADRGQPTNAEEFGVSVSLDQTINARIVSFDNDLFRVLDVSLNSGVCNGSVSTVICFLHGVLRFI